MINEDNSSVRGKVIGYTRLLPPVTFITVVFTLILIYLVVHGILFLTSERIQAYEIGAAARDNISATFTGIVLREEHITNSPEDGYVSCFSVNGDRLSKDAAVCTLDDAGMLEESLRNMYFGQQMLSDESKLKIRDTVRNSMNDYSRMNFREASGIGTEIRAAVFSGLLRDADSVARTALSASCTFVDAAESGFVLFMRDGYEGYTPEDLTGEDFIKSTLKTTVRKTGDHVESGDFLYKLVPDNKFSLVFPMTEEQQNGFRDRSQLTVRFQDGSEISGSFRITSAKDGCPLGVLSFAKYGSSHLEERLTVFSVLDSAVEGFKIPESAILTKNLYTVDRKFITEGGGNTASRGVMVEENGSVRFVETSVYMSDKDEDDTNDFVIGEEIAYIAGDALKPGMTIVSDEDPLEGNALQERMVLGVQTSVEGVYLINSGYCVFRPVVRLSASLETAYVIVSDKVRNSISAYDRIVMDASDAAEYELIYE